MNIEDRMILARKIAAAAHALTGCSDEFCQFMRDGAYDDHEAVIAALGGIKAATKIAANERKSNVVEIAA